MRTLALALLCTACGWGKFRQGPPSPPTPSPTTAVPLAKPELVGFGRLSRWVGQVPLADAPKETYCATLEEHFLKYHWGPPVGCVDQEWFVGGYSVEGRPLVFTLWGASHRTGPFENQDVTLIMCGVHGDEITPVKFCHDVRGYFERESARPLSEQTSYRDKIIVLAPLVNPDAFFRERPSRTNANGVDVNRNLPTADWDEKALRIWKNRYGSDKRRYPGPRAGSEPETVFQVDLIENFRPHKIISVHAPLTMLDYDGPESLQTAGLLGARANRLLIQMSKSANGYRIKNYPFFPGSLGNYAGNERNIPTFTLELPTSDNRFHREYWEQFKGAVVKAVDHNLREGDDLEEM